MSIRRIVELILDRNSAQKVEQGTKNALDKGTDPTKPRRNIDAIRGALNNLKGVAAALGVVFGVTFAVRRLKAFGAESIRVATEARATWNRLAGQLAVAGVRYSEVRGEISATARAMQDATTVGDEQFAVILQELLSTTNDYGKSLQEVGTVANLAAAKQIDLKTAAQLVGRAMVGQTGTLSRYGIIVQEGADVMEVLRERFAGMAANEARELDGQIKQLNNEWDDFKEAVGNAMIEAGGGTSVLQTLTGTVRGFTEWLDTNRGVVVGWARVVISSIQAIGESGRFLGRLLVNSFEVLGATVALVFSQLRNTFANSVNFILDGLDKIPGVNIEFRMNELTPEEFATQQQLLLDDIKGGAENMKGALVDLAAAYRDVGVAAVEAARGQVSATSGSSSQIVNGPDNVDPFSQLISTRKTSDPVADAAAQAEAIRRTYYMGLLNIRDDVDRANPFDGLIDQTEATAAFMRDGFKGVGRAMVAQMIEGRAAQEFAEGLSALGSAFWPVPNPAAFASAGKHFAAAAAFKAVGGAVGGAFGGSSSVPGSAGSIPGSSPRSGAALGAEVHIYLDPLSPSDYRVQRMVAGAIQEAKGVYGENMRLQIHGRTGG